MTDEKDYSLLHFENLVYAANHSKKLIENRDGDGQVGCGIVYGYQCYFQSAFFTIAYDGQDRENVFEGRGNEQRYLFKIHITVPQDKDTLKEAWAAVLPTIIEEGIGAAKVLVPFVVKDKRISGKSRYVRGNRLENKFIPRKFLPNTACITLYTYGAGKDWQKICQRIEDALLENNVPSTPNYQEVLERDGAITGSNYLSYRYDRNKDDIYVSAEKARKYKIPHNPAEVKDYLKNVSVQSKQIIVPSGMWEGFTSLFKKDSAIMK